MSQLLPLRDYQADSIRKLDAMFEEGFQRLAIVLPTGSGKTVIFAHLAKRFLDSNPGKKVVILAHTNELITQAYKKLKDVSPHASVGIVKAERRQVHANVIVASVQSLRDPVKRNHIKDVGLIIVDECFPAGTMVGDKCIQDLVPGDLVPSWNEETGRRETRSVVALTRRVPKQMVHLAFDDGTFLACTPNHPLLTIGGWAAAGMLRRGACVISFTREDTQSPVVSKKYQEDKENSHDARKPQAAHSWRQRPTNSRAAATLGEVSRLAHGGIYFTKRFRAPLSLQTGYSAFNDEGMRGSRRGIPLLAGMPSLRPAQGQSVIEKRVADVQILESGSDGTYGGVCADGFVYNIEVEFTHTYLVNDGIVVHNCHHATAKTYRDILTHYRCFDEESGVRAVGFTATLARSDGESLASVWQKVADRKDISFMIRAGHLINPRGKRIKVGDLDLSKVKKSGGDFQDGSLGEALELSLAPEIVAKAYKEHAADRQGILFAPTVHSAEVFMNELNAEGIKAELVHGKTPREERRDILARLSAGVTQVVCNCMVLTEGFDAPCVSVIVVARPTKSTPLYQQMVGRGLRPNPLIHRDGQDCLILDVVGIAQRHTLASLVNLSEKRITLDDEESLIEAEDALEDEGSGCMPLLPEEMHQGPVHAVNFDPLAQLSSVVWMRTEEGAYFLSAGTGPNAVYVFVLPAVSAEPDVYDVMWCTKNAYRALNGKRGDITQHRNLSLEMAFAWGEDLAKEMGGQNAGMTLNKSASWRRTKPSQKQLDAAKRLGIKVADNARKGDVSILMDTVIGGRRIDPIMKYFAQKALENKKELVTSSSGS